MDLQLFVVFFPKTIEWNKHVTLGILIRIKNDLDPLTERCVTEFLHEPFSWVNFCQVHIKEKEERDKHREKYEHVYKFMSAQKKTTLKVFKGSSIVKNVFISNFAKQNVTAAQ